MAREMRLAWRVGTMKWGSSLEYYLTSSVERSCVSGTPMSVSSTQKSRSSMLVISERRTGGLSMARENIRRTVGSPLAFLELLGRCLEEGRPVFRRTLAGPSDLRTLSKVRIGPCAAERAAGLCRETRGVRWIFRSSWTFGNTRNGWSSRGQLLIPKNCGAKVGERKTVARRLRSRLCPRVCVIPT